MRQCTQKGNGSRERARKITGVNEGDRRSFVNPEEPGPSRTSGRPFIDRRCSQRLLGEERRDQLAVEIAATEAKGYRFKWHRPRRFPQAYRATEGHYLDDDVSESANRKHWDPWACLNIFLFFNLLCVQIYTFAS